MVDIGDILREMMALHPEFSLRIGKKDNGFVAEMRIGRHTPAVAMGPNLALILSQVHGESVKKIADRLLAESRLSEAVFDNTIDELEGSCGRCACRCGCQDKEEDDDYYEDYEESEDNY